MIKKSVTSSVLMLGLIASFAIGPSAHALTLSEAEAIIAVLGLNATQATAIRGLVSDAQPQTKTHFTRNLTIGSSGEDVASLQTWLESRGFLTMPAGVAKGYFGPLTRSALASYQASAGIYPAAGYFGPITISRVNSTISSVTPTPVPNPGNNTSPNGDVLKGNEGDIVNFEILGSPSNEFLTENEQANVFGFEFEADDSDIQMNRLDIVLDPVSNNMRPSNFIESIALYKGSTKIGEVDAGSRSDWSEKNGYYQIRLNNLDSSRSIVREGNTEQFFIEVTAKNNLDSRDLPQKFEISIADEGLRAVDALGIQIYEGDRDDSVVITFEEHTAGEINVTLRSSDNKDRTERVEANTGKNNIELLNFNIESNDSDSVIEDITINVATSSQTTASINSIIKNLTLVADGKQIKSKSITVNAGGNVTIVFDNLDYEIDEGDEVTFTVRADINKQDGNFENGDGISLTLVSVEGEDEQGDDITENVNKDGGTVTLHTIGINAELIQAVSTKVFTADDANEKDRVEHTIKFEVRAFGDDMYIDKSVTEGTLASLTAGNGVAWTTSGQSTGTYTVSSQTLDASGSTSDDTDTAFFIDEGDTRTFTLKVMLEAATDGAIGIQLTAINWDTDGESDSTADNFYSTNLSDYKTDLVPMNVQ